MRQACKDLQCIFSAMRSFLEVLEAIRSQRFFPDRTRSGMIAPAAMTPAGAPTAPLPPVVPMQSANIAASTAAPGTPLPSTHAACVEAETNGSWLLSEANQSELDKLEGVAKVSTENFLRPDEAMLAGEYSREHLPCVQDSEAHFLVRANEYGVPAAFVQRLRQQGVSTLGHLAFAGFRPGSEFEERQFDQWATVRLTMGASAALRRLHFESEIVVTSTIRASVESADTGAPKPIPLQRKMLVRPAALAVPGIEIHGAGEPSHALLDEVSAQFEARAS
eukprot:s740_g16.t1